MDIQKAEEMYRTDPVFRILVDNAISAMLQMSYTPGELRAAAMLAAIKFEQQHTAPFNQPRSTSGG